MCKPSFFRAFMLCCSIFFITNPVFAVPNKDEVDVENVKAPPRDVKDILRVLESTKQDEKEVEKAKKVLAIPVPSSTNPEVLNSYYYRRSVADEILGNTKESAESLKKVVTEYPSMDPAMVMDEMSQYAAIEAIRGNRILANQILEQSWGRITQNIRGWYVSTDRNIINNCLAMGDFDCAKSSLTRLENNYYSLSNAKNVKFQYRLSWEISFEWMRAKVFMAEGKYIEAERGLRKSLKLNQEVDSTTKCNFEQLVKEAKDVLVSKASRPASQSSHDLSTP